MPDGMVCVAPATAENSASNLIKFKLDTVCIWWPDNVQFSFQFQLQTKPQLSYVLLVGYDNPTKDSMALVPGNRTLSWYSVIWVIR